MSISPIPFLNLMQFYETFTFYSAKISIENQFILVSSCKYNPTYNLSPVAVDRQSTHRTILAIQTGGLTEVGMSHTYIFSRMAVS